ncbi:MAG: hypothetical protein WCH34_05955 [Bacteroidota bacterium]
MKKRLKSACLVMLLIICGIQISYSQSTAKDSLKEVKTVGVFDGKKVVVGNFETMEVYKINDYCIALSDVAPNQLKELIGKKVIVTGRLKIVKGKYLPEKTSTNGKIFEPYKEPDKKFIVDPGFTILFDAREPLLKEDK